MRPVALVFVAACELQPPPPSAPAPTRALAATPAQVVVADAAVAPPFDAGVPLDAMTVTTECVVTGAHIADVLIASASDLSLKASYEQARDRIVRSTAEACTSQIWTADAQRCFGLGTQKTDLEACEKKFSRPQAPVAHPTKR